MQNGLNHSYYVRTIPGGGRNFLAALLNKHCSNEVTTHRSKLSNEYFQFDTVKFSPTGDITIPFWSEGWEFKNAEVSKPTNVFHGHHTPHKPYDTVYYVTNHPDDYIYCRKLFNIKNFFGDRPHIAFNDTRSSVKVKPLLVDWMSTSYLELWERFTHFVFNNLPIPYPLSTINLQYFELCAAIGQYEVDNMDHYMTFYRTEFAIDMPYRRPQFAINNEKQLLGQLEKDVTVIQYRDLFLDNIETNTVFDEYKDEIEMYTKSNMALIKEVEMFYGPLV